MWSDRCAKTVKSSSTNEAGFFIYDLLSELPDLSAKDFMVNPGEFLICLVVSVLWS